ncbi:MAG: cation:proton antiporter, partial [Phycisphaerae bacterium]|nr:cation:proton antiporter [Phycisphaerae bacterium]
MKASRTARVPGPRPARWRWLAVLAVALLWPAWSSGQAPGAGPGPAEAAPVSAEAVESHGGGHGDPVAPALAGIVVLVLAARIAGHVVESFGQPAVVGELAVGMVIGNLVLVGIDHFDFIKDDYTTGATVNLQDYEQLAGISINMMSRIGVILLLFQVGLESSVGKMREVGGSALLVAILGVVVPLALGWGAGWWLLPEAHWLVHLFLGATLCATSVGITARVLQDLGKAGLKESRIILGAAVIDDVLGLVVLALAQGLITAMNSAQAGDGFNLLSLAWIMGKAALFLVGALVLGGFVSRHLFVLASYL